MHVTNTSNVEATLNGHFRTALSNISLPSYFSGSITFTQNWSEIEAVLPCFSVHHLPIAHIDKWQGRAENATTSAVRSHALMEISAWVTRDQKMSGQDVWQARLRWMQSMIEEVYIQSKSVIIKDYTVPAVPVASAYLIRLNDMNIVQTAPDKNPAIERRKVQISYTWELRASVS